MSEFKEVYDDNNVVCPYCGHKYQAESEDYSEDERAEECEECGKKYYLCQSFDVTHDTRPDCELNGDAHNYETVKLRSGIQHPFCTVCCKCKPLNELI